MLHTKQNVLQSDTLDMHAKRALSLILNIQSLHLQGIKPTSILCLPSNGTNTETSFCPAVKWTSPRTLAEGDFSQLLAAKLCASACSICTSVEEAFFASVWSLLTTHFICQFPPTAFLYAIT